MTAVAAPKAPPSPPRVILLQDAPTNGPLASFFIHRGYSVEIVRDLKFCSTPLLKSARYIVLNPDNSSSPFYQKIKATLKKMVPDRLFEQEGQDLLVAVRQKVQKDVQLKKAHPQDGQLLKQKRENEDAQALQELEQDSKVNEQKQSLNKEVNYSGPQRSESPEIKDEEEENNLDEKGGGGASGGGGSDMKRKMEEEAAALMEAALKKSGGREARFEITDEIREALQPYIEISGKLRQIHVERESLLADPELPDDAKSEFKRQASAITKPQMPERVIQKAKDLETKKRDAEAQGKTFPVRKLPEGELYDQILETGQQQDDLLTQRAYLRFDLAQWFANNVTEDTLFKIFRSCGVDADYLYGTIYFVLSLETLRNEVLDKQKKLQNQVNKFLPAKEEKKSGLGFFRKKKKEEDTTIETLNPEQIQMKDEASLLGYAVLQIDQDLNSIEPDLVGSFWAVYEQASLLLMEKSVKNKSFLRYIRGMIRFGLVGNHDSLISKGQFDALIEQCNDSFDQFAHEDGLTNIIYPDEAMIQIWDGILPPSYDEELELTGEGTPQHKFDKTLRKVHSSKFKIQIYEREIGKWQAKVDKQKDSIESAEQLLTEKEKGTPEYKTVQSSIRECKAEIARLNKVVEKLTTIIETEKENLETSTGNLGKIDYKADIAEVAKKETQATRKFCKLLANRKEPFLPFLLRDNFTPENNNIYNREVMVEEFKTFEQSDVQVFSSDLVNAQNPRKRVMIRYSPTIIILPCIGMMGFSISPSTSAETGRLVLPLMSPAQSPLHKMVIDMFADFRYDTSKLNAGMDWMTSDTIVAAYAKVRWDFRKKGKEFREKAAIYNDLPDRKNFKFHYALYINSMDEAGKKLFFKCNEMYEAFTKYVPLPDGKQKHKRN